MEAALRELGEECLLLSEGERPEKQWLREVYDRFRQENGGMGKAAADELLYRKIFGVDPKKQTDILKVRYWRTGRHFPAGREQGEALGRALGLTADEQRFLMQGYFDRSDRVFGPETADAVYRERAALLGEIAGGYLERVPAQVKRQLFRAGADLEHSLRHLYFTDAKSYVNFQEAEQVVVGQHISSINYMSEFRRQMRLFGEIPRRTMIRHLLIFGTPFVSAGRLSGQLERFGYLGLDENHTQADGSRLDWLLLRFLELYEESCRGMSPERRGSWFREAYSILDSYLVSRQNTSLRIFYFKSLKDGE